MRVAPVALLAACAGPPSAPAPEAPLEVRTLSLPVDWLVARIGGDAVHHVCIDPPGADPVTFQPTPDAIAALHDADLIVANGAGYEAWTATAMLPTAKLVWTAADVPPVPLPAVRHTHGAAGAHTHGAVDPHTWADPSAYFVQARAVHHALLARQPEHAPRLREALGSLESDLQGLDVDLADALQPLQDRPLAANHPAFGHLARRYHLDLQVFDLDPAVAPGADQVAAVTAWIAGRPGAILLWEAPPSEAATAALPGVRHAFLDPLEQPGASGVYDYLAQARVNVDRLRALASP